MTLKLGAAALGIVLLVLFFQACLSGGGGASDTPSVSRPGSIPTATPPAQLPTQVLLGETRGATTTSASTGGPGANANTYVVKSGDTLGGIAASLGVPPEQQAAWVAQVLQINGIADARLLSAGVALNLPGLPTSTPTPRGATPAAGASATRTVTPQAAGATPQPTATQPAAAATPTATRAPATGGGGSYTVTSGDYPYLIAAKLCVPDAQQAAWVNQMVSLNGIDPSALFVGEVLQLPAGTPTSCAAAPATTSTPVQ